jgi:chromosome segregation ATPase
MGRELTLCETEALLDAREHVMDSAQNQASASELHALQTTALEKIQAQFDEREASMKAAEQALKEREVFIEQSENTIFEKGQKLQELETELEHLRDELKAHRRRD